MSYAKLWHSTVIERAKALDVSHWLVTEYVDAESGGWNISPTPLCILMTEGRRVVRLKTSRRSHVAVVACAKCELMNKLIAEKSV